MRDSQGVRRNRASLAKFALPFVSETHLAGGRTIALGLAIALVILAAIGASDSPAD